MNSDKFLGFLNDEKKKWCDSNFCGTHEDKAENRFMFVRSMSYIYEGFINRDYGYSKEKALQELDEINYSIKQDDYLINIRDSVVKNITSQEEKSDETLEYFDSIIQVIHKSLKEYEDIEQMLDNLRGILTAVEEIRRLYCVWLYTKNREDAHSFVKEIARVREKTNRDYNRNMELHYTYDNFKHECLLIIIDYIVRFSERFVEGIF